MRLSYDPFRTLFLFQTEGGGDGDAGGGGDAGDGAGSGGPEGTGTGDAGDGGQGSGSGDSAAGGDAGQGTGEGQGSGEGTGDQSGGEAAQGLAGRMTQGDQSRDDAGGEGRPDTGAGAPETYAEFTIPDGETFDKDRLESVLPKFKEANLTQEQAQAMVTLEAEYVTQQAEAWQQETAGWLKELKNDPNVGGDKFNASVQTVQGFLRQHASEADYTALSEFMSMGYGDFPPLFRLLHKAASAASREDTFQGEGHRQPGGKMSEKEQLKSMYDKMPDSAFENVG